MHPSFALKCVKRVLDLGDRERCCCPRIARAALAARAHAAVAAAAAVVVAAAFAAVAVVTVSGSSSWGGEAPDARSGWVSAAAAPGVAGAAGCELNVGLRAGVPGVGGAGGGGGRVPPVSEVTVRGSPCSGSEGPSWG